jgi:mRNA interferase RelE/StbE
LYDLYEVVLKRKARKDIARLPDNVYGRAIRTLDGLAADPRPPGSRRLQGRPGYRIRVGDYRIVYEVDDDRRTVTVLQVGHRRDVYRRG